VINITRKIECPVCGFEIEETIYASEWGTEEECYHCSNCGYGYEFAYGNYLEYINGKEFSYTYRTKEEDLVDMNKEYDDMRNKYITREGNHE
jgi:rubredoxin